MSKMFTNPSMRKKSNLLINRGYLKGVLYNKGFSLKDLSVLFDITPQQMSNKMAGRCGFSENEIKFLYDHFGGDIFFK